MRRLSEAHVMAAADQQHESGDKGLVKNFAHNWGEPRCTLRVSTISMQSQAAGKQEFCQYMQSGAQQPTHTSSRSITLMATALCASLSHLQVQGHQFLQITDLLNP